MNQEDPCRKKDNPYLRRKSSDIRGVRYKSVALARNTRKMGKPKKSPATGVFVRYKRTNKKPLLGSEEKESSTP